MVTLCHFPSEIFLSGTSSTTLEPFLTKSRNFASTISKPTKSGPLLYRIVATVSIVRNSKFHLNKTKKFLNENYKAWKNMHRVHKLFSSLCHSSLKLHEGVVANKAYALLLGGVKLIATRPGHMNTTHMRCSFLSSL